MKKSALTLLLILSVAVGLCAQEVASTPTPNDSTPVLSKKELRKQRVTSTTTSWEAPAIRPISAY